MQKGVSLNVFMAQGEPGHITVLIISSNPVLIVLSIVFDEMCRGSKAILTLGRCRQTEMRSRTEQVMSTTGGTMITLVHQLEREN